jgi:hypothetical protein
MPRSLILANAAFSLGDSLLQAFSPSSRRHLVPKELTLPPDPRQLLIPRLGSWLSLRQRNLFLLLLPVVLACTPVVKIQFPPLRDLTLPSPPPVLAVDMALLMVLAQGLVAVPGEVLDVLLLQVPVMWLVFLRLLLLGLLLLLLQWPHRLWSLLQRL